MENKIIILFFIFLVFFFVYDDYSPQQYPPGSSQYPTVATINLDKQQNSEMQELIDFLATDKIDKTSYYEDPHRGVEYNVCAGFTRDLAKNANEYGIKMGGVSLRDTMAIGEGTRYYHAMNYCIIDGQFLLIEPQTDQIFTLESLKYSENSVYKYITIFPNAQMMTDFGRHKATIDIYIYGNYNESEIIQKFPPEY